MKRDVAELLAEIRGVSAEMLLRWDDYYPSAKEASQGRLFAATDLLRVELGGADHTAEIFQSFDGEWGWVLKSVDNEEVATGARYDTEAEATRMALRSSPLGTVAVRA